MDASSSFLIGPPEDCSRPWRVIVGHESRPDGMVLGDARIPPGAPGPGRHFHTNADEGIYVVAGTLTSKLSRVAMR
jgi:hypothetical protein